MKNLEIINDGVVTRIEVSGFIEVSNETLAKAMKRLKSVVKDSSSLLISIHKSSNLSLSYTDEKIISKEKLWKQIISVAIVAEELSHRIIANHVKRASRGRMQTKVFKERADAERWMEVCI